MKFYTFGKKVNPVIVLFPGTCCHWKKRFLQHEELLVAYPAKWVDEVKRVTGIK